MQELMVKVTRGTIDKTRELLGNKTEYVSDSVFSAYLDGNKKFPQILDGILIYTLETLVNDSDFNKNTIYKFSDIQISRLMEMMLKLHSGIKMSEDEHRYAIGRLNLQATDLLGRALSRVKNYFKYREARLENLKKALTEMKRIIDTDEEIQNLRKERWQDFVNGGKPDSRLFAGLIRHKIRAKLSMKFEPEISAIILN